MSSYAGTAADVDALEAVAPILSEIAGWVGIAALVLAWVPVLGQALALTAVVPGGIALVMTYPFDTAELA